MLDQECGIPCVYILIYFCESISTEYYCIIIFQFLSVLISDLKKCAQYLIFCDLLNIFVKRYYLSVTWNIAYIYI
jgi:hypothetical protein